MLHTSIFKKFLLSILMSFMVCQGAYTQGIELYISGIKNCKGELKIGIFKDHQSFVNEKPFLEKAITKCNLTNGVIKLHLELEAGEYGIAILDDENINRKMDTNFLGIPKEGFGFSNYYHTDLSKPNLNNFKFSVIANKTIRVLVKMKYLL